MKFNNDSFSLETLNFSDLDTFANPLTKFHFSNSSYDSHVSSHSLNKSNYDHKNPVQHIHSNSFKNLSYLNSDNIADNSNDQHSFGNLLRSQFKSNESFDLSQLERVLQFLETTWHDCSNDNFGDFINSNNNNHFTQSPQNSPCNDLYDYPMGYIACPASNNINKNNHFAQSPQNSPCNDLYDYPMGYIARPSSNNINKNNNSFKDYRNNLSTKYNIYNDFSYGYDDDFNEDEFQTDDNLSYDDSINYYNKELFDDHKNGKRFLLLTNSDNYVNDVEAKKLNYMNKDDLNAEVAEIYVSWIPKNARCKLVHELPDNVEECEKYPEYIKARDKMISVLKKLGFPKVESITFHPPRGSHIKIRFESKHWEYLFLHRYKFCPHQWKLDMHKHFKFSRKVIDSIKDLKVDTVSRKKINNKLLK